MVLTTLFAALALAQEPATVITVAPVTQSGTARVVQTTQDKRVSLKFDNAPLKDVLGFLRKEKINFVVDPDAYRDRRLTLSLSDVPVRTAMSAIATALDSHWETVGDVRVLKKGSADTLAFRSVPYGRFLLPQDAKGFKELEGMKLFRSEDMAKRMNESMKSLEMNEKFKGFDKAQQDEIRKSLENAQKEMSKQKFEFKGLDKAQSEEIRKALESARAEMGKNRALFDSKTLLLPKEGMIFRSQNIDGLLKSITPAQKELQKKQGYLKLSDLTAEQRAQAGIKGDGKIEIVITRDGETLKIKND
jgi:hypothetical protein